MEAEPKKPWWQMTRTPASGFWLGGFWVAFGLVRWWWLEPGDPLGLAIGCLFVLMGAGYLASSAAMLRRRRTAEDARRS